MLLEISRKGTAVHAQYPGYTLNIARDVYQCTHGLHVITAVVAGGNGYGHQSDPSVS